MSKPKLDTAESVAELIAMIKTHDLRLNGRGIGELAAQRGLSVDKLEETMNQFPSLVWKHPLANRWGIHPSI